MVRDVERSISFYRDVIGLSTTDITDSRAKFDSSECTLVLEEDFDETELQQFGLESPGEDRGAGVITVIEVDAVDVVHDRAVEHDAEILMPPTEVDWGRKMFLVADPDGYVLEVSRATE